MSVTRSATRLPARMLTRRLMRAWPIVGGILAVITVAGAVRRKGFLRGVVDTALDAMPVLGPTKNLIEFTRGRDFIREGPARRH